MSSNYVLKGINDDYDTCELCGKTGLKRVMWLAPINEDGEEIADPGAYGTTCGAKLLGLRIRSKAKIENKVYEMLIERINNKAAEIMNDFVPYANRWLLPADLRYKVCGNEMTINQALEERVKRHPILEWNETERTRENAQKFAKYL